ncbi:MAG: hypothetical protein FWD77_03790 [Betaproteobacteria bacterium]|nr:hypothetical protein [Betaproteobacteria bacterium]
MAEKILMNTREHPITLRAAGQSVTVPAAVEGEIAFTRVDEAFLALALKSKAVQAFFSQGWLKESNSVPKQPEPEKPAGGSGGKSKA